MFKYTKAICRKIPRSIVNQGLRLETEKIPIDYDVAEECHTKYIATLKDLGLKVTVLEADETLPDCVFVEDTAVIVENTVLITRPGALSREPEVNAVKSFFVSEGNKEIVEMKAPASLDGGDVLFTGYEFFVGLSIRTNEEGIMCLRQTFPKYPVHTIKVSKGLHLKSFMSMIGEKMIACSTTKTACMALLEILTKATQPYSILRVAEDAAANVLFINDVIVCRAQEEIPESFEEFNKLSAKKISLRGAELEKVDGALTCSSLLFN